MPSPVNLKTCKNLTDLAGILPQNVKKKHCGRKIVVGKSNESIKAALKKFEALFDIQGPSEKSRANALLKIVHLNKQKPKMNCLEKFIYFFKSINIYNKQKHINRNIDKVLTIETAAFEKKMAQAQTDEEKAKLSKELKDLYLAFGRPFPAKFEYVAKTEGTKTDGTDSKTNGTPPSNKKTGRSDTDDLRSRLEELEKANGIAERLQAEREKAEKAKAEPVHGPLTLAEFLKELNNKPKPLNKQDQAHLDAAEKAKATQTAKKETQEPVHGPQTLDEFFQELNNKPKPLNKMDQESLDALQKEQPGSFGPMTKEEAAKQKMQQASATLNAAKTKKPKAKLEIFTEADVKTFAESLAKLKQKQDEAIEKMRQDELSKKKEPLDFDLLDDAIAKLNQNIDATYPEFGSGVALFPELLLDVVLEKTDKANAAKYKKAVDAEFKAKSLEEQKKAAAAATKKLDTMIANENFDKPKLKNDDKVIAEFAKQLMDPKVRTQAFYDNVIATGQDVR